MPLSSCSEALCIYNESNTPYPKSPLLRQNILGQFSIIIFVITNHIVNDFGGLISEGVQLECAVELY